MTGPRLPPGAGMKLLLRAMMTNDPTERATLLWQVCPQLDQNWALDVLQTAREDQDARHGYAATEALHGLLVAQSYLDRSQESKN